MKVYQHLFFDLDHTLWDHDRNTEVTLREIYDHFQLKERGVPDVDLFHQAYTFINKRYWKEYRNGQIDKTTLRLYRFKDTLLEYAIDDEELSNQLNDFYIDQCPRKGNLFPHTLEVLQYLQANYRLHIITNGFEEVQTIKLQHAGLTDFFHEVIISEMAGHLKPHPEVFNYSLRRVKASKEESLMIGDNLEADILGAKGAGWDTVFVNFQKTAHEQETTFEIHCLSELTSIL